MSEPKRQGSPARQQEVPMLGGPPGRPGGFGGGPHRGGTVVKPKNFQATMRRLWQYFGNERRGLSLIALFVVLGSVLTVAGPYLIGVAVDSIETGDMRLLYVMIFALAAAYIGDGLLTLLQGWMMAGLSQQVVKSLRGSLFEKLQKLPLSYFDARPHGEIELPALPPFEDQGVIGVG